MIQYNGYIKFKEIHPEEKVQGQLNCSNGPMGLGWILQRDNGSFV